MSEEFEGADAPMSVEQGTVALLSKAEIDQQIATAHRFPRSIKRFRDQTLQMVTLSESVAAECIYSLPRDGKVIEGPSARFAEVVASAWGNCRAGSRVVNENGEFVTAQGVFHDLERNVAITYEVQRRITNKYGKKFSPDMIGVTANAACSVALRNAILKGVPKAFWSEMYERARQTVMGDFQTLSNRRAKAVKEFQSVGVTKEMICGLLQVDGVEDISLPHLVTLAGLLTSIREGDTTVEQAFGASSSKSADGSSKPAASAPADQGRAELPGLDDAQFADMLKKWVPLIQSGKKQPAQIVAMAQTRNTLTQQQVDQINTYTMQEAA